MDDAHRRYDNFEPNVVPPVVPCFVHEDQPGQGLEILNLGIAALESGDLVQEVVTMSRVDTARWADPSRRSPLTIASYFGMLSITGQRKPLTRRLLQLPCAQAPLRDARDHALEHMRSWRDSLLAPVAGDSPEADILDASNERVGTTELALDRAEHLVVTRFPVTTDNPRIIAFSRIETVSTIAADLAAGRI